MSENKSIAINSFFLALRLIIVAILSLFSTKFLIKSLGVEDFGLISIIASLVFIVGIFNTIMTSTTFRFLAFESGKKKDKQISVVFNLTFSIHLCIGVVMLISGEAFGINYLVKKINLDPNKINSAAFLIRFSLYSLFFLILSVPYQGLLNAHEKFKEISFVEVIKTAFIFIISIFVFYTKGEKIKLYAVLMLAPNIFGFFSYFLICKRYYADDIKLQFTYSRKRYKEILNYSSWLSLGTSGWVLQRQGGDLIINHFFGTTLNAAIGIANQVNNMVTLLAKNLGQASAPQIIKSISGQNSDRQNKLIAYISKYSFFVMLIVALPLLLETDFFLKLWLSSYPPYTIDFCKLIIFSSLIETMSGSISTVIMGYSKVKYFMIFSAILSFVLIPVTFYLYSIGYSPKTIFCVNIIIQALLFIINNLLMYYILKLDIKYFFTHSYSKVLLIFVLMLPVLLLNINIEPVLKIFIGYVILFTLLTVFGLSSTERVTLCRFLKAGIKKYKN